MPLLGNSIKIEHMMTPIKYLQAIQALESSTILMYIFILSIDFSQECSIAWHLCASPIILPIKYCTIQDHVCSQSKSVLLFHLD